MTRCNTPSWTPLLDIAPEHVDDFMWMFEVELDCGSRLHAYKHSDTRQYVHLTNEGRAFIYCGGGRYREVDPAWLLAMALAC
jgi:hypothetical protein